MIILFSVFFLSHQSSSLTKRKDLSRGARLTSIPMALVLLLLVSLFISSSEAQLTFLWKNCDANSGNYTLNSTYFTNLNILLTNLTTNATTSGGFSDGVVGNLPDRVYGIGLCRGDVDSDTCQACLSGGSQDVLDQCPLAKSATVWYDYCLIRYSSSRFSSSADSSYKVYMWNINNVSSSDLTGFNQSLFSLMGRLRQYAAYNTSALPPAMFSVGQIDFKGQYPTIYGLLQCTRDLSPDDCNQCLTDILADLPKCCDQKIGGRVIAASCNFRYEVARFYNTTSRLSLPAISSTSPLPSPPLSLSPPPLTNTNSTGEGKKKDATGTILTIVIPVGVVVILILFCCVCFFRRKRITEYSKAEGQDIMISSDPLLFDLTAVRKATDDFSESNKLGEGGFGSVYKGILENGEEIAVKRLSASSGQGVNELRNEVVLLSKLQHRNLVRLLGVCVEEEEKLLVIEYVQNKSLDTFLFDPRKKEKLNWERRYKIIGGIARGLLYLHEESQVKIIHRDLKPSNILLDPDMNPKISDFGFARLFGGDQTRATTTRVVGTFGYMSPEYALTGQFSNKSDVFSFGILVLEIITGLMNTNFVSSSNSTQLDLISYVWEHWTNGTLSEIIDSSLDGNYPQVEALRCIQLGLLCLQEAPSDRPTMSTVVLMLSSYSVSASVPSRPAFLGGFSRWKSSEQDPSSAGATGGLTSTSTTKSAAETQNEISITELGPR